VTGYPPARPGRNGASRRGGG